MAVAVDCVLGGHAPSASCEGGVLVLDQPGTAVDIRLEVQREATAGAEQVALLDAEAAAVLAALSTELDFGLQGPGVLGDDLDIDGSLVDRNGADVGVAQIAVAAQSTLRLLQDPRVIAVAGAEQQLRGNRGFAADDVDSVGEAEQGGVLGVDGRVEHVDTDEADFADHGAAAFQRRILGYAGRAQELAIFEARTHARQQVGECRTKEQQAGARGKPAAGRAESRAHWHRVNAVLDAEGDHCSSRHHNRWSSRTVGDSWRKCGRPSLGVAVSSSRGLRSRRPPRPRVEALRPRPLVLSDEGLSARRRCRARPAQPRKAR